MSTLLAVENLRTGFDTREGFLRAVDGVDFEIPQGGTLGVVGESGCGKSVTALSVMRLIDRPGRISDGSRILFEGRDLVTLPERELEKIRGNEISMIFQEPMTSLNPVFTVGDQIGEAVQLHQKVGSQGGHGTSGRDDAARRHPLAGDNASATIRTSSRAACASA